MSDSYVEMPTDETQFVSGSEVPNRRGLPLYVRLLIGVALGILFGLTLRERAGPLGELGLLVIRLLKALATPLILFAILDAFLQTRIPARKGAKLISLSLLNATVAIIIGLTVANVLRGGIYWQSKMAAIAHPAPASAALSGADTAPSPQPSTGNATTVQNTKPKGANSDAAPTLNPVSNLAANVPESVLDPFLKNNVIAVVLLAVLLGAGLRTLKDREDAALKPGLATLENLIRALFRLFALLLEWLVQIIPFAVFGIVAQVVGKTGVGVFGVLGGFLATILFGLALHAFVYYALLLRVLGRTSPRRFYAGATDAIVTALSCGSSLATLPVTLRCLNDRLKVSPDSARLAACVGTNLNHDGIILYEAAAAIFLAQAFAYPLTLGHQIQIALASVMAGVGIAGIPEAGLVTLPLVLSAAGLPASLVGAAIPLILPVDWIIGRGRAMTNVLSDMTVAVLLDRDNTQTSLNQSE